MRIIMKTALTLCAMVGAQPLSSLAELNANGNPDKAGDVAAVLASNNGAEEKPRAAERRPNASTHNLRCWQYGRLIFEEAIAEIPAEVASAGMAFPGKDEKRASVYLLDTKGGAICLAK